MDKQHIVIFLLCNILCFFAYAEDFNTVIVTPTKIIKNVDIPYTISTPGVYWLGEDIAYAPSTTGTSAITISVGGNAVLDLKNFSLAQTNATATTSGITISGLGGTLKIRNGTLSNFTGIALTATVTTSSIECTRCIFQSCAMGGMQVTGAGGTNRTRVTIDGCRFIGCASVTTASTVTTALQIIGTANTRIRNCVIAQCGNAAVPSTSTIRGIGIGSESIGTPSTNTYIENVVIANNNGGAGNFYGIQIVNNTNARLVQCQCDTNTAGTVIDYLTATGGAGLTSASSFSNFISCLASNNNATNTYRAFWLKGNAVARDCAALNNIGGSAVYAFTLDGTNSAAISCLAQGNSVTSSSGSTYAFGFSQATTNGGIIWCNASYNTVDRGYDLVNSSSATSWPSNSVVIGCIGCDNSSIGFGASTTPASGTIPSVLRCIATGQTTNYDSTIPAGGFQAAATIAAMISNLTNPWTNIGIN